ncbi:MAG: hypothetical protein IPK27_07420 [Rhodanobacteraceae bacterium]|nr:hypothetical protein [Rhodanobacteraceae bacterium]
MYEALPELDELCAKLGVPTISSFVGIPDKDGSLTWKMIRKKTQWFEAGRAIPTFEALRSLISANPESIRVPKKNFGDVDFRQLLLEELEDCLSKVAKFANAGDPFHVSFVS